MNVKLRVLVFREAQTSWVALCSPPCQPSASITIAGRLVKRKNGKDGGLN